MSRLEVGRLQPPLHLGEQRSESAVRGRVENDHHVAAAGADGERALRAPVEPQRVRDHFGSGRAVLVRRRHGHGGQLGGLPVARHGAEAHHGRRPRVAPEGQLGHQDVGGGGIDGRQREAERWRPRARLRQLGAVEKEVDGLRRQGAVPGDDGGHRPAGGPSLEGDLGTRLALRQVDPLRRRPQRPAGAVAGDRRQLVRRQLRSEVEVGAPGRVGDLGRRRAVEAQLHRRDPRPHPDLDRLEADDQTEVDGDELDHETLYVPPQVSARKTCRSRAGDQPADGRHPALPGEGARGKGRTRT